MNLISKEILKMDSRDLIDHIRQTFPIKNEDELKKAREDFVAASKKQSTEDLQKNYFKIYGKSPYLYNFEPDKK
jgi:hypothetical protein